MLYNYFIYIIPLFILILTLSLFILHNAIDKYASYLTSKALACIKIKLDATHTHEQRNFADLTHSMLHFYLLFIRITNTCQCNISSSEFLEIR